MISAVDKININVRDQDAARRFWVETMGFSLVTDEPIGEEPGGARWIEVRPPHSAVTLVLRCCSPAMTDRKPTRS